jgi:hypothetical protein
MAKIKPCISFLHLTSHVPVAPFDIQFQKAIFSAKLLAFSQYLVGISSIT